VKVFVFGAGASLGSQEHDPNIRGRHRAPLVDELFAPDYQHHATLILTDDELAECRQLSPQARSVEAWLTERWQAIDAIPNPFYADAERGFFGSVTMYAWLMFSEISTAHSPSDGYGVLLRALKAKREEFGLISFNYETLLDKAFQVTFRRPLQHLDDYFASNFVKPHGSVNWFLPKRNDDRL